MQAHAKLSVRRSPANPAKQTRRPNRAPAPIIKWAGGKGRLLAQLAPLCPTDFRRYYEPFVGGGAMYFHLNPNDAVLNDQNEDLINMYRCVAWNVEAVIRRLSQHRKSHDQAYYYSIRSKWNEGSCQGESNMRRAAAFIYLNKTCYNGLWRVNSKGGFNVPIGRYQEPKIFDSALLRTASVTLQQANLQTGGFAAAVDSARAGDFVYFDPPYHPLSTTANFTSYTAGSFSTDDQQTLAKVVNELTERGCAVMISNSDTPFIRKLYKGHKIHEISASRAINSVAKSRGPITEVAIVNRHC